MKKVNLLIILSFIALSLISVCLLLKTHVMYLGMDTQFHFRKIMELSTSLINENIFPNFSFNYFHGSSVLTLYPYLNLMPYAIFSFITKSKIHLVYLIIMFNVLINFIISFYSCKNYTKSYITSYIFSIIYSMSNVFLFSNIISSDFGIVSSYILLPLIIFGFLKIIKKQDSWIQLSLGMSLLFYSHILNLIIIGLFLLLFLLININKINSYIIINFIKSILLFVIITSVIWLPFLHLYFTNLGNINMPTIAKSLSNVRIKQFISGLYGSKSDRTIGFFPLVALFISPLFYKMFTYYIKQIYILSVIIILSVLFLPWKIITSIGMFKFLNQIQGVHRFLIIPLMLLSFIFSLIITQYLKDNTMIIFSILIVFIAIFLQLIMGQYTTIHNFSHNSSVNNYLNKYYLGADLWFHPIHNSKQFNKILNLYYSSDDDYIPKSAFPISQYVNHNLGFYNNRYKIKVKHIKYNTFTFSYKKNMHKLVLPIYVYNKEKINIYLNHKPINNFSSKNNLLMINNIQDNIKYHHNEIYIKPIPDKFRIIGSILSIFGWILVLIMFINNKFIDSN